MEEFLKNRITYLEKQLRISYLVCTILLASVMIVGTAYLGVQIVTNRNTFIEWQTTLKEENARIVIERNCINTK